MIEYLRIKELINEELIMKGFGDCLLRIYASQTYFKPCNIVLSSPKGTGKSYSIKRMSEILSISLEIISFPCLVAKAKEISTKGSYSFKDLVESIFDIDYHLISSEKCILIVIEDVEKNILLENLEIYFIIKKLFERKSSSEERIANTIFIMTSDNYADIPDEFLLQSQKFKYGCLGLQEKMRIVKKNFIKNNELYQTVLFEDSAIEDIIKFYTKEAGVNELRIVFDEIAQYLAELEVLGKPVSHIGIQEMKDILGLQRYNFFDDYEGKLPDVIGLAWTDTGGILLPFECIISNGIGRQIVTGNVGKIMLESIQVVIHYMNENLKLLGIEDFIFQKHDIFINIPEIALSKNGASAALAVFVLLYTKIKNIKLNRIVAFTGEISLTGKVIRVGGLKEKFCAAINYNIKDIVMPWQAYPEYCRLSESIRESINPIFVHDITEVLYIIEDLNDNKKEGIIL